jgi:drug/metabolite transporter (DMT)-like permease
MSTATTPSQNIPAVFTLCLISSFFLAIVLAIDNFNARLIGQPAALLLSSELGSSKFLATLVYLPLGGLIGVVTQFFFAKFVGHKINPDFNGLRWYSFKSHRFALLAGLAGSGSTAFYLWGSQEVDPSVITVLGNVSIMYVIAYEVIKKEATLQQLLFPSFLILLGSMLVPLKDFHGLKDLSSLKTLMSVLFILVVGRGITYALGSIFEQRGIRRNSMEAVNFAFWRFVWLAVFGTLFAISFTIMTGQLTLWWMLLQTVFWSILPLVVVLMLCVFIANTTSAVARQSASASTVALLLSMSVILSFPITLIAHAIKPNIFGKLPELWWIWLLRIAGTILVVIGAIRLRYQEQANLRKLATHPSNKEDIQ